MRKQDYTTLANLVRDFLADDSEASKNPLTRAAVQTLAICFASRANVDKVAFLRACGIET